jgi:2-keto-myo-inositol isomerase
MKIDQIAINSVSNLPHPLEKVLDAYANAGFRNVEFYLKHVWDAIEQGKSPADVKRMLDDRGQTCIGGFEVVIECFTPKKQRAKNHRRTVKNVELLASLGARCLVAGTDGPSSNSLTPDQRIAAIAESFGEVADRVRAAGITICLEFNWGPAVRSLQTAAAVANRARRKNVGILFDPAHYYCTPSKSEHLDKKTVQAIRHVHVDDMPFVPGDLANCDDDRVLPLKGCLDLPTLFARMENHGYNGFFSLEMFDKNLWAMPPNKAAKLMYASMKRLVDRCSTRSRDL